MHRFSTTGILLLGFLALALASGCPTAVVETQPTPTPTPEAAVGPPPDVKAAIDKAEAVIDEVKGLGASEAELSDAVNLLTEAKSLATNKDYDTSKLKARQAQAAARIASAKTASDHAVESGISEVEAKELTTVMDGAVAAYVASDFDKAEAEAYRARALAILRGLSADISILKNRGVPAERIARNQKSLDEARSTYEAGKYTEAMELAKSAYAAAKAETADLLLKEARGLKVVEGKVVDDAALALNRAREGLVSRDYYRAYLFARESIAMISEPLAKARGALLSSRLAEAKKLKDEKNYAKAIEAYEGILKTEGLDKDETLKELAETHMLSGDDLKAASTYERLGAESKVSNTIKDAYLKGGEIYEGKGDLKKAEQVYKEAYAKLKPRGVDFFEEVRFAKGRRLSMHHVPAGNSHTASDKGIEVVFPKGALEGDSTLIVTIPGQDELVAPEVAGQTGFRLTGIARRLETSPEVKTFLEPVIVKISYDVGDVEGYDRQVLAIYRLNEASRRWEKLDSTSFDAENSVVANAPSFSSSGEVSLLPAKDGKSDLQAKTPGFSILAVVEEERIEIASKEADEIRGEIKKSMDELKAEISKLSEGQKSAEAGLRVDLDDIRNSIADILRDQSKNSQSLDSTGSRLNAVEGQLNQVREQQRETEGKINSLQETVSTSGTDLRSTRNELLSQLKDIKDNLEPLAKVADDLKELKAAQERLQADFNELSQLKTGLGEFSSSASQNAADIEALKTQTAELKSSVEAFRGQLREEIEKARATLPPPAVVERPSEAELAKRAEELKKANDLYASAKGSYDNRRYREAEERFKILILSYPDLEIVDNAHYWLGETYYAQGLYQDALREFRQVIANKHRIKDDSAQLKLGYTYYKLQDYENALVESRKLLAEYPNSQFTSDARFLMRLSLLKLEEKGK